MSNLTKARFIVSILSLLRREARASRAEERAEERHEAFLENQERKRKPKTHFGRRVN